VSLPEMIHQRLVLAAFDFETKCGPAGLGGNIGIGLAGLSGKAENPGFIAPRTLVAVPCYHFRLKRLTVKSNSDLKKRQAERK
jgi:hypothetical protein